jgi:hypothetical protein
MGSPTLAGRPPRRHKIVVELMFDFWRYLSSAAHENTLWVKVPTTGPRSRDGGRHGWPARRTGQTASVSAFLASVEVRKPDMPTRTVAQWSSSRTSVRRIR